MTAIKKQSVQKEFREYEKISENSLCAYSTLQESFIASAFCDAGYGGYSETLNHLYNTNICLAIDEQNKAFFIGKLSRFGLRSQYALNRATQSIPLIQSIDSINRLNNQPDYEVPMAVTRYENEFAAIWDKLVEAGYDVFFNPNVK